MRTSPYVIALLFAAADAYKLSHRQRFADGFSDQDILNGSLAQGICDGTNGSNMQDCRVSRWHDQNPVCRGRPGEEKERNCLDRPGALAQGICDGTNGSNMQDCRVSRWHDQNPVCRGRPGEEKERNCLDRPGALAQGEPAHLPSPLPLCNGFSKPEDIGT
jgi:hypothetical protein